MFEDAYVRMLIDERDKIGISTRALCEGVYNEDMFYCVEQGKRTMDRVTAKRLLARLGVDNGNYEHYLDAPNYEIWQNRMQIINLIENSKLREAEQLLNEYSIHNINSKNISRNNIEKQFCLFMKAQILNNKTDQDYSEKIAGLYEEAVKLTVPNIDTKVLRKLVLSPVETNLALEYKKRCSKVETVEDTIVMYKGFLDYIETSPYGNVSAGKIYPKVVIYMYDAVCKMLAKMNRGNVASLYREMLHYVMEAKQLLIERKLLYYLVELLEVQESLLCKLIECDSQKMDKYVEEKEKVVMQLKTLKATYLSYKVEPYMKNDCFLYRESGIYCANDIIKTRRNMKGLSQEQLCGDDISVGTLKRIECEKKAMKKETLKVLFEKMNLYPSCVNMGIVTDKKEALAKYEKIRFAIISFKTEELKVLINELEKMLDDHPINKQVLLRIGSQNKWRMKEITDGEFVKNLINALECTTNISEIRNADDIFITTEELMTLYLISTVYKENGDYKKAMYYISDIWLYCKEIEKQGMETGRLGIYELVMEYIGNLLGDMGRYAEANDISHKLIKICLHSRRGGQIHSSLYNIAWNNNECNKDKDVFNDMLQQCIIFSQLMGDTYDEAFYKQNLL